MNETLNQIDEQYIKDQLLAMRRNGWKVKFEYDDVNNLETKLVNFRANKKHVNLRGKNSPHHWKSDRDYSIGAIDGWIFSIYTRNMNGGYGRIGEFLPLDDAIAAADKYASEAEPEIPTWKRSDLPEAFALPEEESFKFEVQDGPYYRRYDIIEVQFERLIYTIRCLGVVSIGGDCTVSIDASMTPGAKAWFLMECYGTRGKFLIISDGDMFYPIKKISMGRNVHRYKISLDAKIYRADLRSMGITDTKCIRTAAITFASAYAEQFK